MFRFFWLFWLILTLIVIYLINLSLTHIHHLDDKNRTLLQPSQSLAAELFNKLVKEEEEELITINRETDWRIQLPNKYKVDSLKDKNGDLEKYEDMEDLVKELLYQPYGKSVREQVALWNYSRRLAAIRDNRLQEDDNNAWKVSDENGLELKSFSTIPWYFGYITQGQLVRGYHDWKGTAGLPNQTITFSSTFTLKKAQTIRLQIIGTPDFTNFTYQLEEKKKITSTNNRESVYQIAIRLSKGVHAIKLPITPMVNPTLEAEGLALSVQECQKQTSNDQECKKLSFIKDIKPNKKTNIELVWHDSLLPQKRFAKKSIRRRPVPFRIMTRDKQFLTEKYTDDDLSMVGKPTSLTEKLGLTALIGQGKEEHYALSGLMWSRNNKKDAILQLSIDSRLQKIAQSKLQQGVKNPPSAKHRAAVVMLNGMTGEILAAASYPSPKIGIHHWDYQVMEKLYNGTNPYLFNPWQGDDRIDNTPGSTFKVVTAMAGLQIADDKKSVSTLLTGANLKDYYTTIGLKPFSDIYKIHDVPPDISPIETEHTIAASAGALLLSECANDTQNRKLIGLQETTKDSVNTWYAHLGILMDRHNIEDKKTPELVKMAEKLGFNAAIHLDPFGLQNIKKDNVLNAKAGKILLPNENKKDYEKYSDKQKSYAFLRDLAQNSFGQGLTATPLQMAKIAASIATGNNTQPQLLMALGDEKAQSPKHTALTIPHLDWLRQGMQAVVQTGTAKGIFKGNLKCQVYGKTGTADVGKKGKSEHRISSWFIGWHASDNKPPLAFACMATHYPSGKGSGAKVCGTIMNNILTEMKNKRIQP